MTNLFLSLHSADDETIAMQAAILKSVTPLNVAKPYAQKFEVKAVQITKQLADKFDKKFKVEAPQVKELQQRIDENYRQLRYKSREELDIILRDELKKRIHDDGIKGRFIELISKASSTTKAIKDDTSLSKAIILEAAKNYSNIEKNLTTAQKADAIAREFHNRIRQTLNDQLKNQTAEESAETERLIDQEISKLNGKEKDAMKKAMRVDDLTGKAVRSALITAGLPALVLGTTSGASLFVATSTIMHAVFTTMLGITLPFAAYTGAMSLLGVLTGPIGWGLIIGVTAFQAMNGSSKLDREMLSQLVWLSYILNEREYKESVDQLNDEVIALRKASGELIERLEKNKRNRILRNEEIRRTLIDTIDHARYEIDIVSPWMNQHVVNDFLIKKMRTAIQRGVTIKIRYGIGGASYNKKEADRSKTTQKAADKLRRTLSSDKLILMQGNEHSKLFICDDTYYVITSFNPLSFDGDYSEKNQRGEIGEMSNDIENLHEYRKAFFANQRNCKSRP